MSPLFSKRSLLQQIWFEIRTTSISFKRHLCWCKPKWCLSDSNEETNTNNKWAEKLVKTNPLFLIAKHVEEKVRDGTLSEEGTQIMLRDLLFWAVFTDRIDMAKVFILHIRPRICAALTCAAILKSRARKTPASDKRHLYKQQADDFELYATDCINACYFKSERKACELMIREVPLFGNITCMQVAISSNCSKFINTDCFSQTLNLVWFNKLAHMNFSLVNCMKILLSLMTFGFVAPWLISYRLAEETDEIYDQKENQIVPYAVRIIYTNLFTISA